QAEEEETSPAIEDDRDLIQDKDKTLLIIEDDRDFAQTLRDIAHEQNFKCLIALDGQAGIQTAQTYSPDAIILDIGLPKIDGWSVIDRLKSTPDTRHIPIHCISGKEEDLTARRMGAMGYLLKPVSMGELVDVFHRLEQFLNNNSRKMLILNADVKQLERIQSTVVQQDLEIDTTDTLEGAQSKLKRGDYDCIIVDLDFNGGKGISFLESIQSDSVFAQIPTILHAERKLDNEELQRLRQLEEKLILKPVDSPENLLEETTLFLHQITAKLPEEKQSLLRMTHDKEALLSNKKILIVDDDMRNFFALAATLEDKEMSVINANNGEEALSMLKEESDIDLVLMDIMMPIMDGYEAMRQIRAQSQFKNLPIIALTAKAMKEDRAKCIEAGANDYLPKPVDVNKLLSLMRVWLYR
ncbi:MAG: response regulator, partial [Pseudomonadota bacterium]